MSRLVNDSKQIDKRFPVESDEKEGEVVPDNRLIVFVSDHKPDKKLVAKLDRFVDLTMVKTKRDIPELKQLNIKAVWIVPSNTENTNWLSYQIGKYSADIKIIGVYNGFSGKYQSFLSDINPEAVVKKKSLPKHDSILNLDDFINLIDSYSVAIHKSATFAQKLVGCLCGKNSSRLKLKKNQP